MAMASIAVLNYQRVSGLMFHNISLTWNFQPLIFSLASPLLKKAPEMFGPLGMIPPTFALIFFLPRFYGNTPKKSTLLRFFQPHVHSGPRLSSDYHLVGSFFCSISFPRIFHDISLTSLFPKNFLMWLAESNPWHPDPNGTRWASMDGIAGCKNSPIERRFLK